MGGGLPGGEGEGQAAGVEPLEEPFEDFGFFFRQADGLVEALGEGGVEGCGEEGAGAGEEFFVDEVGDGWAGGGFLVADDDGRHAGEGAEGGAKGDFGGCTAGAWA